MTYNNFDIRSGGTCRIPESRQVRLRELARRLRDNRVRNRRVQKKGETAPGLSGGVTAGAQPVAE